MKLFKKKTRTLRCGCIGYNSGAWNLVIIKTCDLHLKLLGES